jgi:D-galactose 1-dehydrogenase
VPAIASIEAFELIGVVDPAARIEGVQSYASLPDLLSAADPASIAVCTPPQVRYAIARAALEAGKHVLLEKPPTATVGELEDLTRRARAAGVTLFTAWHSQFAPAVPAAKRWVEAHAPRHINVAWREDVRRWHPGQVWIWEPGGLGVFDPGINALSILTAILDVPIFVTQASIEVPKNRSTPIGARLALVTADGARIDALFDWRHTGTQTWDIAVEDEDGGEMLLSMGGHRISGGDVTDDDALEGEYPAVYRRFAALIEAGQSEIHADPLRLVADAFMVATSRTTEPFVE